VFVLYVGSILHQRPFLGFHSESIHAILVSVHKHPRIEPIHLYSCFTLLVECYPGTLKENHTCTSYTGGNVKGARVLANETKRNGTRVVVREWIRTSVTVDRD
jgi:hypothetical protein